MRGLSPIEFADRYLQPYELRGSEIIPEFCPYCKGGRNRDRRTFALNIESGAYNCKRGSCGKTGTFYSLCRDFGEQAERRDSGVSNIFSNSNARQKQYIKPSIEIKSPTQQVIDYLQGRGISRETIEKWRIGSDSRGNLAFPFFDEHGEHVFTKFRSIQDKIFWRERGGKPIFYGMWLCDPDLRILHVTEGEIDALSLSEAGIPNVVSLPSGAEDFTCFDLCWDWLQQFDRVIIWGDNDTPGHESVRRMIQKFGEWRCAVVDSEYKDANECLQDKGPQAIMDAVINARDVPVAGILRLSDVQLRNPNEWVRIHSSIPGIDRMVGGYRLGELTVWTGANGSGKSTFLGQEILAAIDQGYNAFVYSGELPRDFFKYWVYTQAAGGRNELVYDEFLCEYIPTIPKELEQRLDSYYSDRLFLFDNLSGVSLDNLLQVMEFAVRRHDCRVFLVDNLMKLTIGTSDRELLMRQGEITARLHQFAERYEVHVHLVAHPRKTEGRIRSQFDVSGSSHITDLANNVLSVYRVNPADFDEDSDEWREIGAASTLIDVLKNRGFGRRNMSVPLLFDTKSRRFYPLYGGGGPDWKYKWETEIEMVDNPAS